MSPFCREHWTNNLDATFSTGSTFNPDSDFKSSHVLGFETCMELRGKTSTQLPSRTSCLYNISLKKNTSTIVGTEFIFGIGWRASTDRNASVSTSYLINQGYDINIEFRIKKSLLSILNKFIPISFSWQYDNCPSFIGCSSFVGFC